MFKKQLNVKINPNLIFQLQKEVAVRKKNCEEIWSQAELVELAIDMWIKSENKRRKAGR